MRSKVLITVVCALSLSACGSQHGGAVQAKVVAAKVNVDKEAGKRDARAALPQAMDQIRMLNRRLVKLGFDGLNDTYTIKGRYKTFHGYDANERKKIKSLLTEADAVAESMVEGGRLVGGLWGWSFELTGGTVRTRAANGLADMDRRERDEKEAKRGVLRPYFGGTD